ncbi:MAG: HEAT repeat domain-containing protein, partial [Pirellulales bacterium]|nr:HEAT repeat domain-containing protein [Pirellulales bacterium]
MLNQEQAEAALKKFKSKEYAKRRKTLCGKLPGRLRETSRGLCGCNAQGKELSDWFERQKVVSQAAVQLDAMTDTQRKKVFAAMFPQMTEHVETAWQQMKSQPYQESWVRKPFRSPASPELSLERRGSWLADLLNTTAEYDQPITWFAEWAGHILGGYYGGGLGTLFAAAIDGGGKEGEQVYQTLVAGASGEHEIAQMGHHVIQALLLCSREDAWEFMVKMLLAAQREEGLRQSILENVDIAHPGAFRRMLRVILDENLVRFAATVRAADVWLGLMWDSASAGVVKKMLEQVSEFLQSKSARDAALRGDDAQAVYLALWTIAFEDTAAVLAPARKLLKHKSEEVRFAAAVLLDRVGQVDSMKLLLPALADADLRVAAMAVGVLSRGQLTEKDPKSGVFDSLEKMLDRFPQKKTKLKPLLWPWYEMTVHRQMIGGAMLSNLGDLPVDRMLPYIRDLDVNDRFRLVHLIGERKRWNCDTRDALFALVGDAGHDVRTAALDYIAKCKVTAEEAEGLEKLLTRKSGDLRRGVMSVLLGQKDPAAMASIERLLAGRNTMQRQAGIELLLLMIEDNRRADDCRQVAQQFADAGKKIPAAEKKLLDTGREVPTLYNALGLMNPADRAEIPPVVKRKVTIISKAAAEVLYSLDALIYANREAPVECESWDGSNVENLLGNLLWGFPYPDGDLPIEKDIENLPLREIWEQWLAKRPAKSKDADGLEFVRAEILFKMHECNNNALNREGRKRLGFIKLKKLRYAPLIERVLPWLIKLSSTEKAAEKILDMVETSYASVPEKELNKVYDPNDWNVRHWRESGALYSICDSMATRHFVLCPGQWNSEHFVRFWKLGRWQDEPFLLKGKKVKRFEVARDRVDERLLLEAYEADVATDADIYDAILGPRDEDRSFACFSFLNQLTWKKPHEITKDHPWITEFADRCCQRVLDVELQRGDAPTEASAAAGNIACVWGIPNLVRIVLALGKDTLTRNYVYGEKSKKDVFSNLLRVTMPSEIDTAKALAAAVKEAGITEKRLLEVATFAPQWAGLVEGVLGWKGLEDAIWWIHAHTKDDRWSVGSEIRESWESEISERTPLSGSDLVDGAVDVAWFHRVYDQLKKSKWEQLDAVAKYASGGGGHKRAQLFADAMLGRVKKTELVKRMDEKRHQDTVRALGLLPLSRGKSREKDILDRYKRMQEFIRTSRQFGSQRQTSERRAAAIAQANLARTAGYKDPIRLQ